MSSPAKAGDPLLTDLKIIAEPRFIRRVAEYWITRFRG